LAFILLAAKGRRQFSIDNLLSMPDDDRPYAIRRAASPDVSPDASPVARTVTKRDPKRDPKRVADILKKWKRINPKSSGGKTKKKGQRTHRRKKNTSRSLYTIK
jgi:hypothetical protein